MFAILTRLPLIKKDKIAIYLVIGGLILIILAAWKNALLPLKLYPVLVNIGMLLLFGLSLVHPPSVIERFARIHEPSLPDAVVRYARRVTQVWCVFFVLNGTIAMITSLYASDEVWVLYNGVIAYILMGVIFAIEYLFRLKFRRIHNV